jgi:hypothetical protein
MVFNAFQLFIVTNQSDQYPLNLKFDIKEFKTSFDFSKRIIYSILLDGKIIYIGFSYEDKQKDVRKSRWAKQLETILFRGYRVGLNKKAYLEFEKSLKHNLDKKEGDSIKIRKTDVMTSSNRIICASKHWGEIKKIDSKNDTFLTRISFQIEDSSGLNSRKDFEHKAKELIKQRKPCCNG